MILSKLIEHNRVGNFHYFVLEGIKSVYKITVIKLPDGFEAEGWHGTNDHYGFYKVINEERNTERASNHTYSFLKHYFDGKNKRYMPHRIGINEEYAEDFMDCVSKFVYPVI